MNYLIVIAGDSVAIACYTGRRDLRAVATSFLLAMTKR